jgi:hypothetical protein
MACAKCEKDVYVSICEGHFRCFKYIFSDVNVKVSLLEELYFEYVRYVDSYMDSNYWEILIKCEKFFDTDLLGLFIIDNSLRDCRMLFSKVGKKESMLKFFKRDKDMLLIDVMILDVLKWINNKLYVIMFCYDRNWVFEI